MSHTTNIRSRAIVVMIGVLASLGFTAVPASAQEPASDVHEAVFTGEEILNQQLDPADAEAAEQSQKLLDLNARGGMLTDAARISTAILEHPADGSPISVSWEGDRNPEELFIGRVTTETEETAGGSDAVGLISSTEAPEPTSLMSGGSGFGGATMLNSGMYLATSGCSLIQFTPGWSNPEDEHAMTTCYQKFALSGSDLWAYNRYTNFNIAAQTTSWPYLDLNAGFVDFTIRARPVSGTDSNFHSLRDWAPRDADINCPNAGSANLGVSGFNLSIPIDQCSNTETFVGENGSLFHFARDYDGPSPEGQETMTLDAAIAFQAANTTVIPSFADYDWVEIGFCQTNIASQACDNDVHFQWDSGW